MKNRFCVRTKLSEEVFLNILGGFCKGMTATETHEAICDLGQKVSRQAVEMKFLEIGQYFYNKLFAIIHFCVFFVSILQSVARIINFVFISKLNLITIWIS